MGRPEGALKVEGDLFSFPKKEKLHEKEPEGKMVEGIGERYDALLAERERLQEELEKYNPREYETVFSPEFVPGKELQDISTSWQEKARKETDFFKPLDSLGIKVLSENLENQPNFPEEKIVFGSTEVHRQNITRFMDAGGATEREKPRVEILPLQPSLRDQLANFLKDGNLDKISSTLVHELVHRHHFRANKETESILTEAQAFFSGIYEEGPGFSMAKIAKGLSKKESEGGYGYDANQVYEALRGVATLYGFGMSSAEVSDLISRSRYDERRKKFVPFSDTVAELLKKNKIDEIDSQSLDDLYRLHAGNERLKARLLLFRTIGEHFPAETLRSNLIKEVRTRLGVPTYFSESGDIKRPPEYLVQRVCCPVDDQFPYDPDGKRTGIVFGFFEDKDTDEIKYGIGRWEAEGTSAHTELAQGKKVNEYLKILKKSAPRIDYDYKADLLYIYIDKGIIESLDAQAVLRSLFSREEGEKAVGSLTEHFRENLSFIEEELRILSESRPRDKGKTKAKIGQHLEQIMGMIKILEAACKIFGLKKPRAVAEFDEVAEKALGIAMG